MPAKKHTIDPDDLRVMLRNADRKERAKLTAKQAWPTPDDREKINEAARSGKKKVELEAGTFTVKRCKHKTSGYGCVFVQYVDGRTPCGHFEF